MKVQQDRTEGTVQQDRTEGTVQQDRTEGTIQRDGTERTVQQDKTEGTIQRDGTERTVQQDKTEGTVQQDRTERTVQRDGTERTVRQDGTERTAQRDETERTAQQDRTERTVQRDGTERTVWQDRTERTVQRDGTERTVHRNREILPLDDYLQISGLPFKMSPQMMAETAFFGVHESSFASAEKMIRKYMPTQISDSLIRKVTEYVGRKTFEEDTRRACPIERNLDKIPDKPDKKGILYIMVDGATVNTRLKDEQGSSWRENKLGLVFSSTDLRKRKDGVTHDILKKEYMPCLGSAGNFKKYLLECAVRNGYGRYEQTILLSDGASWIRNMGEEIFPDALQILDFYHLAENIYSFGKYLFHGDAEQYTPWAEELIELLRNSQGEEVLRRLEPYKGKTFPAGVVNPYTYIEHNKNKIDYAEYKRQGYYIGSGPIESGNKTVVQKRCKQAGMRWNEANAQEMLTLKAKEESGIWGASVRDFIMAA